MTKDESSLAGAFATGEYTVVGNIREFPPLGTPSNIVNVPVYGQSTSSQVQAQADAPEISVTINYVPSVWEPNATLGALVQDGKPYLARFTYMTGAPDTQDMSTSGIGTVPNATWYAVVKLDGLEFQNSLSDTAQATLTMSLPLGKTYGPYTQD
jgi:hypothetical protein